MEREYQPKQKAPDDLINEAVQIILENNLSPGVASGVTERTNAAIRELKSRSAEQPPLELSVKTKESNPFLEAQAAFSAIAQANGLTEDERIEVLNYIRDNKIDIQAEGRDKLIQEAIETAVPRLAKRAA